MRAISPEQREYLKSHIGMDPLTNVAFAEELERLRVGGLVDLSDFAVVAAKTGASHVPISIMSLHVLLMLAVLAFNGPDV